MKVKRPVNTQENWSSRGMLFKPKGLKWFDNEINLDIDKSTAPVSSSRVSELKTEANALLVQDVGLYRKFSEKRKDFSWIHTVMRTGTLTDKISAHVLLIQDSPIHNLDGLNNLVGMVTTKGKRECLMAMDTLRDIFVSDLLVEDRKLKTFEQHPLAGLEKIPGKSESRNKFLLMWFFEDKLKSIFLHFVKNLEAVSHDTVEKTKQKAVSVMAELLKCNPEQEQFLLEHLANKIGDPLQKVGAHVCHLLGQVVDYHPNIKGVVLLEVERLLFRPNITERTKYYCLCFLNQLILSHEEKKIANHLIKIYFGLFKVCVRTGEVNNKIMSALLTGVTRAHPYAAIKDGDGGAADQLDAMYKIVHLVNFNISVQALSLIFQVLDSKDSISERFYSALYRKLLDPEVASSSRQSMLLNLIHKALKKDVSSGRIKAFIKRLLQISLYQAPHLQCGILYLISDLSQKHPNLFDMKATVLDSDSDDDEHYNDVVDEDDEKHATPEKNIHPGSSSWLHKQNKSALDKKKSNYDPLCRNPLYAGAEYCTMWELRFLRNSFHPSVSLFAQQVATSQEIRYSGDPLLDFTLARFLDRFVYRNPKKPGEKESSDVHRKVFGGRKLYTPSGSRQLSVTSEEYLRQDEAKVPVEENFIFTFLRQQAQTGKKKKEGEESDIESVNSDEFEEILDKYHAEDEGKDTLDFMRELNTQKTKKAKKPKSNVSESAKMAEDADSLEGESELEEDFENDESFQEAFEDFEDDFMDADEMKGNFEDEDFGVLLGESSTSRKKKRQKLDEENMFASADQFATLLEDNSKVDGTMTESFVNKDKSDAKQILWEKKQDQYVRGVDWKSKKFNKGQKRFQKGGKKFQKGRKGFQTGVKKFARGKK